MNLEERLRRALSGRRDAAPRADCPAPEALAAFVAGDRRREVLEHVAACPSCREDLIAARTPVAYVTRRAPRYGWIAAAAAALFAVAIGAALLTGRHEPEAIVIKAPKPAPKPRPPEPAPIEIEPAPKPLPEIPKPAPLPEVKPAPKPAPPKEPERPAIARPIPEPEPPKPQPAPKPETKPALTKAKLRGSFVALAGTCSAQPEGEAAWQGAKFAQPREFAGSVKLRADASAAKARIGAATYFLRGGTEIAVAIEEGSTLVRLVKGEAFFDVTPGPETFAVETATGKTTVKGTRFLVTATETAVQRGKVEFTSADRTVAVAAGERSIDARAPEKVDVARRLAWMKPLEETLTIEAEGMALAQGMVLLPDPAASGGRAVGLKGPAAANTEPSAEVRLKRKQATPYAVWVRLHWGHNVAPGFSVQVHDAPRWSGKAVPFNAAWQWVRVGAYELPDEPFRIRVIDPQGGLRVDQILVTSDLDFNPDLK